LVIAPSRCAVQNAAMTSFENFPVIWLGAIGATLTTLCWVPQAVKLVRERETRAISLPTNVLLLTGILFWLAYGIAIGDWPLIVANIVSMVLTAIIVVMKLRHG
jgi:MtN3 and saliva related transmembrane protein